MFAIIIPIAGVVAFVAFLLIPSKKRTTFFDFLHSKEKE